MLQYVVEEIRSTGSAGDKVIAIGGIREKAPNSHSDFWCLGENRIANRVHEPTVERIVNAGLNLVTRLEMDPNRFSRVTIEMANDCFIIKNCNAFANFVGNIDLQL